VNTKDSTEALALAIADGRGSPDDVIRAERDQRLGAMVAQFRKLLGALDEARVGGPPPEALLHWARVWARETAPGSPSVISRLLEVLSFGVPGLAEARGVAGAGQAVLYGDERYHLDVRLETGEDGSHRVRGQVLPASDAFSTPEGPWSIRVLGPRGRIATAVSDDYGEFRIDAMDGDRELSLVAERGTERLIVARLATPSDVDAADGKATGDDQ